MIVRDYVAPRVLNIALESAAEVADRNVSTFAATTWLAAEWKLRFGIWKRG